MAEFIVDVTQSVKVTLDESKFTPEFMEEFRRYFYPFYSLGDHAEHIAQLAARELLTPKFTEGYGPLADMGIEAKVISGEEVIISSSLTEVTPA